MCSISYMGEMVDAAWLRGLPTIFTYTQARQGGLSERHLYQLRDQGLLEQRLTLPYLGVGIGR